MPLASPVIMWYYLDMRELDFLSSGKKNIKDPVYIPDEELAKLTVDILGFKFINFAGAFACPTCGIPQGVIRNEAPDKKVGFYLAFNCEHYTDPAPAAIEQPNPEQPQQ